MSGVSPDRKRIVLISALSILSGLVSGVVVAVGLNSNSDLLGYMVFYLPGVSFALLALFPLLLGMTFQMLRGLLILSISIATHYAAVRVSVAVVEKPLFLPLIVSVGAIAAAIVSLCSAFLLKIKVRALPSVLAVLLGGVSGLSIGAPFSSQASLIHAAENVLIVFGYVIWQCGVAVALAHEKTKTGT